MTMATENAPATEKIFAAVTTEMYSTAKLEEVSEQVTTFKYYLKSNRPIYGAVPSGYINAEKGEIRVPRKGYFYGVATYDKPLTAKQILDYDLRPEDDSEIEKVNNYMANCILINCLDDYIVDIDAATDVEEINSICYYETKVVSVRESEIKAAVAEYHSIGEHFDDIMDISVDEGLPNWEREQKKLERRHYATERKAKVKFLRDFFKSIGLPRKILKISIEKDVVIRERVKEIDLICFSPKTEKINPKQLEKLAMYFENYNTEIYVEEFIDGYEGEWDVLDEEDAEIEIEIVPEVDEVSTLAEKNLLQEKIATLRTAEKIISEKYLSLCRNLYVKIDGEYHSAVGFNDYVTKFHDTFYCKEGNNYVEDAAAYSELKEIEREWNSIFKELEYFENIEAKADILKAKIAEQKKFRKPIIDWKATFEDMQISEILDLQKDFKKFLKLGQTDLAENVFSMLKTLCKNYRAAA